jgi:hypothetical protein
LLDLLLAMPARANIGPRWHGDRVAEPWGLRGVLITQEHLTIDMRPLVHGHPVAVEVVYWLSNPGGEKKLDLLFVSGTELVDNFAVSLGEQRLESQPASEEDRAQLWKQEMERWKMPDRLPGIDQKETYSGRFHFYPGEVAPLAFFVLLPPGMSTLRVRYQARAAGADEYRYPTATWQFPYILAPAREWGGFGGLDVTVQLPAGWQSASEPLLERDGDTLRRSFSSLPADVLCIAARAPIPSAFDRTIQLFVGLYIGAVLGGGLLCWWLGGAVGRYLSRRVQPDGTLFNYGATSLSLLTAVLWVVALFAVLEAGLAGVQRSLGHQQSPYFHEGFYQPFCGHFLLMLLILPVGYGLTWINARRAGARASGGVAGGDGRSDRYRPG